MKNPSSYNEAFEQLQKLVAQVEQGEIPLDQLADQVKLANKLIAVCEKKLKAIEGDLEENKED